MDGRPAAARTSRPLPPTGANYGMDAPGVVKNLALAGASLLTLGLIVILASGALPPLALEILSGWTVSVGIGLLAASGFMAWGSKVLKPRRLPGLLLRTLALEGHERVLDVGCGRGLILTAAAKSLTEGRAIGVDIWRGHDQSGNTPLATCENARAEGVADRVEVITADARWLPFEEGSFDAVLTSLAIHNISGREGRRRALMEMARVLRAGGRMGVLDFQKTGEYAEVLGDAGMSDVSVSPPSLVTFPMVRIIRARKPEGSPNQGSLM